MSDNLVSVIVVSNRVNRIKSCINFLQKQSYHNFEIIIIWNGSTQDFINLKSSSQNQKNIFLFKDGSNNVSKGRNMGIDKARGRFIAFTDDDCVVYKDWLKYLVNKLILNNNYAGVGSIRNVENKKKYLARLWQLNYIKIGNMSEKYAVMTNSKNIYLCTSSALFNKSILTSINGFDERLISGEDYDISTRIKNKGYLLILEPKAIVTHFHPETWNGLVKQQKWYGYGSYQIAKKFGKNIFIDNLTIIQNLIYKYLYSLYYSLKSKNLKLIAIFPFYVLVCEFSRYYGYCKGYLNYKNP